MKSQIIFTCLFFFFSFLAFSQEEKHEATKKSKSHHEEMEDLKMQLAEKDQKITELTKQIEDLKANSSKATSGSANGIVFKVQVGTFKNKDLSKYFENNKNFSGDTDEDGSKKYTLGNFTEYWEADNFKKYLREMGVKDAWLVAYKNGSRVNIKDVLEGNIK